MPAACSRLVRGSVERGRSPQDTTLSMVFSRPFFFAIRDERTGTLLGSKRREDSAPKLRSAQCWGVQFAARRTFYPDYPEVRAEAAFRAAPVCCGEAVAAPGVSWGLSASSLRILRPRSAGVKGF